MTLGLKGRELVEDIIDGISNAVRIADINDMNAMDSLAVAVETVDAALAQNFDDHLADRDCEIIAPIEQGCRKWSPV